MLACIRAGNHRSYRPLNIFGQCPETCVCSSLDMRLTAEDGSTVARHIASRTYPPIMSCLSRVEKAADAQFSTAFITKDIQAESQTGQAVTLAIEDHRLVWPQGFVDADLQLSMWAFSSRKFITGLTFLFRWITAISGSNRLGGPCSLSSYGTSQPSLIHFLSSSSYAPRATFTGRQAARRLTISTQRSMSAWSDNSRVVQSKPHTSSAGHRHAAERCYTVHAHCTTPVPSHLIARPHVVVMATSSSHQLRQQEAWATHTEHSVSTSTRRRMPPTFIRTAGSASLVSLMGSGADDAPTASTSVASQRVLPTRVTILSSSQTISGEMVRSATLEAPLSGRRWWTP
ncbi:hypothetical protein T06_6856 [Trichinella sp. T6]|nr:hypothetical protein T06_6856 [Trichinella sp. T6]